MMQVRTRRHVCFAAIVEGDAALGTREACEAAFFARLAEAQIDASMIAVNEVGWSLVVDAHEVDDLRDAVRSLNLALRVRSGCARVTFVRDGNLPIPAIDTVIDAMAGAGIGIVHLAGERNALSLVVDEHDARRAQTVLCACAEGAPRPAA